MTKTTTFVWDPVSDSVLSELDELNTVTATYTNEPQQFGGVLSQRRDGVTSTLHADALGTTRAVTDDSENVTDTYLFDAWGNQIASIGSTVLPFKWVGRYGYYQDQSTSLVYVRARMYQPGTGRWISVDPLVRTPSELLIHLKEANTYAAGYFATSVPDPTGDIVIRTVTPSENLGPQPCVRRVWVKYQYLPSGKQGWPCDGYLIQHVAVSCNVRGCDGGGEIGDEAYLEIWEVTKREFGARQTGVNNSSGTVTDNAIFSPTPKTYGSYIQTANVGLFCKRKNEDTTQNEPYISQRDIDALLRSKNNTVFRGTPCHTTAGTLLGRRLSSNGFPGWWNRALSRREAPAHRFLDVSWNCCPDCPPGEQGQFAQATDVGDFR